LGRYSHLATQPERGPQHMLKWKLQARRPPSPLDDFEAPFREYDRSLVESGRASLTWIGHASFLLVLGGQRILIDPILTPSLGVMKRLVRPGIPVDHLTDIDAVLITHNHRDHMDEWTLSRILAAHAEAGKSAKKSAPVRPRFIVPIGNGRTLARLGAGAVDELEWWQSVKLGQVEISLVPSRHWSMRMPWDRNESLWGGYVIRGPEGSAYHSGDTGFFDGFAEIGARFGPIDWAMLPIGAYAPRWFMEPQHMCPEEAVQAAQMLSARTFVAMHWATFKLTDEPLGEPPVRARAAFREAGGESDRMWIMDIGETRRL
jgi:L-ascorbate metabolism protein UlaG (beta-lactamase superfamily)